MTNEELKEAMKKPHPLDSTCQLCEYVDTPEGWEHYIKVYEMMGCETKPIE